MKLNLPRIHVYANINAPSIVAKKFQTWNQNK